MPPDDLGSSRVCLEEGVRRKRGGNRHQPDSRRGISTLPGRPLSNTPTLLGPRQPGTQVRALCGGSGWATKHRRRFKRRAGPGHAFTDSAASYCTGIDFKPLTRPRLHPGTAHRSARNLVDPLQQRPRETHRRFEPAPTVGRDNWCGPKSECDVPVSEYGRSGKSSGHRRRPRRN